MQLVPSQEDVVGILRQTGAIRDGHFEYPNGLHANEYLQVQLAMRYFQHAKVLSVGGDSTGYPIRVLDRQFHSTSFSLLS